MGCPTKFAKFFIVLIFASFVFVSLPALATVYLKGTVTLDGAAYTGTTYVSLYCSKGDSWWGPSAGGYADSKGRYSFDSTDDTWNPCSSTNAATDWNSCEVYAYQWADKDIANSDRYAVDLDCSTTITQDLPLIEKEEIIAVTLKSGTTTLDRGMSVYCYQNVSPSGNGYETEADDDDIYRVKVTPGTYECYAYCEWSYWYYRGEECSYAGNPRKTVSIVEGDVSKSITLDFTEKNKIIHMAVNAGTTRITSGIEIYCSGQSSPWTFSRASKVGSSNTYDLKVTDGSYYCSSYCTTWPCRYSGYPHVNVSVGSSVTEVDAELTYTVKDKKMRVSIYAGATLLTSNMNVYCYQQGGNGDYAYASSSNGSYYELEVGQGTYRCSAYCNYWGSCKGAGYPEAMVTFEESDTDPVDVTLTFLESNATLRGVVTGGGTVWVSANGYDIASEDGNAATLTKIIKAATVTGGKADTTQVWASTQVESGGVFELMLPAGSYMLSLWPSDRRYGSFKQEVTVTANETTIINATLEKKDAEITGTLLDENGNGVKGWINGYSHSGDYFWTETGSDGTFTVYAMANTTYNITASPNTWSDTKHQYCSYTKEGMQAVTAQSEAQKVNFTVPTCGCTLKVNAVNDDGDIESGVYASVDARPTSYESGEWYYGIWGWLSGGTGQIKVEEDRAYKIKMWLYNDEYVYDGEEEATCADGASAVDLNLSKLIDNAVSGGFVDGDGNAITPSDINSYLYVHASKKDGHSHRSCELTAEGYQCDLSEGTWILGYYVGSGSIFQSSNNTSNEVEISSKGGHTYDLTFLKTGNIRVTVLDLDESVMPNIWVECNPFSSAQEGANDYQYYYGSAWCKTDGSGQCSMSVGAPPASESDKDKDKDKKKAIKADKEESSDDGIAYYCNAHRAFSYHVMSDEQEVLATEGTTTDVTLRFKEPDGSIAVTVVEGDVAASALSTGKALTTRNEEVPLIKQVLNATAASSPVVNATVYCFSPSGGNTESMTDESGSSSNVCTTEDAWFCVGQNIVSNAYYLSEAVEVDCTAEGTPVTLTLDHVTNVPEGVSQTVTNAAEQSIMIELSDGASFFFPKGALGGDDEMVTARVDPVITPFTSNKIPASFYGYRVAAEDANGVAITQLNAEATFTLPLNADQLANLGLSTADTSCAYPDVVEGVYTQIPTCTVADSVSIKVDHLTDFVIVGNGYLGGIQGEDGGAVGKEDATGGDEDGSTGSNRSRGGGGCALVEQQTYQAHLLGLLFVLGLLLPIPLVRIINRK